jgi:DNA-binding response OmpR family regulator
MVTVLIVDDEPFFLTILEDFISHRLGMRALPARDGATALSILEQEPVDLVLVDIMMPQMDGLELLRRIKERWPVLPVLMLSASTEINHAIVALREGADNFFRKPIDLDELELCIDRVRGKSQPATSPSRHDPTVERRRAPRVRIPDRSAAHMELKDVTLIDLSLSGALVEHSGPVSPGEIYRLSFTIEDHKVGVLARTIRAFASHRLPPEAGGRQLMHRTGVEFVGIDRGAANIISAYVNRLREQGSAGLSK